MMEVLYHLSDMMKLSFRNLRSSVQRLTSQYPLLVLSLVVLLFLSLDAIWSRDIISVLMTDDKHVALIFLIVISIIIGVGIYSRPCKHNILIHLTSIAGLGLWRYLMPDTFAMSHGIMIAIVGFISLLWLIRRPLPSWNHDVLSIHTRISDLLRHISLGALFAILLGAGLSAALGAIDALFSVSIDSNRYVTIFATSGIIVGLISAIDGILFDTSTWSTLTKPKIMLARIIGILIAIFGVILYVYLAQIIITWTWPSNEVARR
ncbi:MAG: DUF4153 domain-containing protein [Candidatus Peribacteria bacterium]|nr:MAG: DUF4153 domain-containing protein [Candidatus Peribacteria bacterium]